MVRGTDPESLFIHNQSEMSFIFQNDSTISFVLSLGAAEWLHAYFKGTLKGAASISVCVLHAALSDHTGLLGSLHHHRIYNRKPKMLRLTTVETICPQWSCQVHRCFNLIAAINYILLQRYTAAQSPGWHAFLKCFSRVELRLPVDSKCNSRFTLGIGAKNLP